MKKLFCVLSLFVFISAAAHAETKDFVYDGKEIYVHTKREHVTTVIFPERIIRVVRSFGADSYVIQRNDKTPDTLELMPTDSETAEMTVGGASGEDYVLRCLAGDTYYTKLTIHRLAASPVKSEEKTIITKMDVLPDTILGKKANSDHQKQNEELPPQLNVKVTLKGNDLPLKIYLATIAQATGYNVITTPEVDGQKTSIDVENLEVWRALKSLLYKFGWGFKVSRDDLIITSLETRVFNIRMPAVDQTFSDETSNTSYTNNQNNAPGNLTSGQGQDVKVGTKITYENKASRLSLWADLENSIKSMITPQAGSYSISKSSGSIIVTDKPGVLDKIGEIIDSTNRILSRQQTFEIQIYEISLSDSNETGVDWSAIEKSMKGINALNLSTSFSSLGFTQGQLLSLTGTSSNSGSNGVTAVLKALASQGDVHTISKPKITVTNLFPAVIQEVTSVPYIAGTGQIISNVSTISNVTTSQVSDGLTMRLDAKISDDNNTVLNISVAVNTLDSMTTVPVGSGLSIQEPQVSTKSITTNVEIDPDKTLILGGLMSTNRNNSLKGIPYLSKIPLLGGAFSYRDNSVNKSELVIFITPKNVLGNP